MFYKLHQELDHSNDDENFNNLEFRFPSLFNDNNEKEKHAVLFENKDS